MHVSPDGLRPLVAEVVAPLSSCLSYKRKFLCSTSTLTTSTSTTTTTVIKAFPMKLHSVKKNNESRINKGSRRYGFSKSSNVQIVKSFSRFFGIRNFRLSKRSLRHFFHRKEFRRKGYEYKLII